jgi:hypothetical protein
VAQVAERLPSKHEAALPKKIEEVGIHEFGAQALKTEHVTLQGHPDEVPQTGT